MRRRCLVASTLWVLWASAPLAGTLDEGVAAHRRGDYGFALVTFRGLAQDGNLAAQYNLGQMYRLAQGVVQDHVVAANWYRLAAQQGDAQSQYNLGVMHFNAQGVSRSLVLSHMWLTLAATSGADNAVRNRAMLARQMTPEQVTQALQLARECRLRDFKACE
jgi:TPR repeat protein